MKILFLCASNVFRSQMAEAFLNKYSTKHAAKSAALIKPQEKMHKQVMRALKEKRIDIGKKFSKKVTPELIEEANLIILMSPKLKDFAENIIPQNKKVETWDVEDIIAPETDDTFYQEFVKARDTIEQKVKELIEEK